LKLSQIFASAGRQNILRVLSITKEIGITKLVKKTNSTYNEVNRNLHILEREGIIKFNRFERRCNISLNCENAKTERLLHALKIWDTNLDNKSARNSPTTTIVA
jgi:predicted transcriptional regulator